MKIRSKFIADAFQYKKGKEKELKKWLEDNLHEILKITKETDIKGKSYLAIYYIDKFFTPQLAEIYDTYWLWLDEMNELNYATDNCIRKDYEEIKSSSEDKAK